MSKDPVSKTKDVRAAVQAELGFDPLVDAADIAVRNIAGDVMWIPANPNGESRVSGRPGIGGRVAADAWARFPCSPPSLALSSSVPRTAAVDLSGGLPRVVSVYGGGPVRLSGRLVTAGVVRAWCRGSG